MLALLLSPLLTVPQGPITTTTLLREMVDLERLSQWPDAPYRTVQYSSYDRRSTHPDAPSWFSNADGFGREPVPGFAAVLREADEHGIGEYLVCDAEGPGAIVRGWSAGMDGILRVFLDGAEEPVFEGRGYDFLARRSARLLGERFEALPERARLLLQQEDADYLPMPFAGRLRITWEGRLRDLHFYHLQVRLFEPGTKALTFAPEQLTGAALAALTAPPVEREGLTRRQQAFELEPGKAWATELVPGTGHAVLRLSARVESADVEAALRGSLLRIACDGSQRAQVEAPLGDFFGCGPGVHPFESLPVTVTADGTMTSRWVMPYRESLRIQVVNHSGVAARYELEHDHVPYGFDDDTLYFRARWRVDHELHARGGARPIDLPYLVAIGRGRLVGLACMLMNPQPAPRIAGNWWGEGDEKILVDGETTPSTFGTGSEDYYNYSWSRWALFDFPYCGQPLDSGPGNCGYVTNYRFQVLDDIPFRTSIACALELWSHRPVEPLSYGRIAYWYAAPGAFDDHRDLQPAELIVRPIPPWPEDAFAEPGEGTCMPVASLGPRADAGELTAKRSELVRSGELLEWTADRGAALEFGVRAARHGTYRLQLTAAHRPYGAVVRLRIAGQALTVNGATETALRSAFAERVLNLVSEPFELEAGEHRVRVECVEAGLVGLDIAHLEFRGARLVLEGALEAEAMTVVEKSTGLEIERQGMSADRWTGGRHLWVRATGPGAFVTLRVEPPSPGRYRVLLRLTKSWDYGVLAVRWNGETLARDVDTWSRDLRIEELDLGARELTEPAELTLEVTGSNEDSRPPHYYFGLDSVVLSDG